MKKYDKQKCSIYLSRSYVIEATLVILRVILLSFQGPDFTNVFSLRNAKIFARNDCMRDKGKYDFSRKNFPLKRFRRRGIRPYSQDTALHVWLCTV